MSAPSQGLPIHPSLLGRSGTKYGGFRDPSIRHHTIHRHTSVYGECQKQGVRKCLSQAPILWSANAPKSTRLRTFIYFCALCKLRETMSEEANRKEVMAYIERVYK